MSKLYVVITYDIKKDKFTVPNSNIKPQEIKGIVDNFLRSQVGAGEDDSEAAILDVYEIKLMLDLTFDDFWCEHNCGNKGLREGILMTFVRDWEPTTGEELTT